MNKWIYFRQQRQYKPKNLYFPQPVQQVAEEPTMIVGRGRSVVVSSGGDMAFNTCVEILAKRMAQTKWSIYGSDNKEVGYLATAFNSTINLQPYYGINAYDFWEYMEKQRLLHGNAFAYICGKGMECKLVPLDASQVTMYWDDANILDGKRKIWYQYNMLDGSGNKVKVATIPVESMLHFKAFALNGLLGRKAVEVLRDTLLANAEVESAMRGTINNGFAGTILLQYTSDLSESRRKELIKQVKELMNGAEHTIVPLPAGVTSQNISNDVKAYHQILKQANTEAISALFGIPMVMLNKASGEGVATLSTNQMSQFYNNTIAPIVSQYANELTIKLLSPKQVSRGFKFDISSDCFDFLDAEAKSKVLCAYVNAGILKRNEARTSLMYMELDDPVAEALTANGVGGSLGDNAGKNGGGTNE